MENELRSLDHEFIEAVDGSRLSLEGRPSWVRPSALGCLLSHRKAYRRVIEDDIPGALILEDDAILPADIDELALAVIGRLKARELALLYYRAFGTCPLSERDATQLPGRRRILDPVDPSRLNASGAYVITRDAAEAFLDAHYHEADAWGKFVSQGILDRVRCVSPRPVRAKLDFISTIGYADGRWIPRRVRHLNRKRIEWRMSRFPVTSKQ